MKKIFVIGAGRSSSSLIRYLLNQSEKHGWKIKVGDRDLQAAIDKINKHPNGKPISFDVSDTKQVTEEIKGSDIVISMLPARMHIGVIKVCIAQKINVITPSYISKEVRELDSEAKEAGILIMNELGVDPGIDHMSAMKLIDEIKENGGEMLNFESFTGGLVSPESLSLIHI